jgi:hypothetical protein
VSFTPKKAGRYILIAQFEKKIKDYTLADRIGRRLLLTFAAVVN